MALRDRGRQIAEQKAKTDFISWFVFVFLFLLYCTNCLYPLLYSVQPASGSIILLCTTLFTSMAYYVSTTYCSKNIVIATFYLD